MNSCLLSTIWFIFMGLFFFMGWREHQKSKKGMEGLENLKPMVTGQVKILGIDFADMLGRFKDGLNQSNKESHKIATTSYFLAGLVALASFIISLL